MHLYTFYIVHGCCVQHRDNTVIRKINVQDMVHIFTPSLTIIKVIQLFQIRQQLLCYAVI